MTLCENCLDTVENPVRLPVGFEKGPQRDPFHITRTLCETCANAVQEGRWDVVHEMYSVERKVTREQD